MHSVFDAVGATNVRWVWAPNIDFNGAMDMRTLYPGDSYVDWVGLDGYNLGDNYDPYHSWQSFTQIFTTSVGIIESLAPSKPLMIAETGSVESPNEPFMSPPPATADAACPQIVEAPTAASAAPPSPSALASTSPPESKASWIFSAFVHEIPLSFPQIRAVVWFDQNNSLDKPGVQQDFCANSSPASQAAFTAAIGLNPAYSAAMPG